MIQTSTIAHGHVLKKLILIDRINSLAFAIIDEPTSQTRCVGKLAWQCKLTQESSRFAPVRGNKRVCTIHRFKGNQFAKALLEDLKERRKSGCVIGRFACNAPHVVELATTCELRFDRIVKATQAARACAQSRIMWGSPRSFTGAVRLRNCRRRSWKRLR